MQGLLEKKWWIWGGKPWVFPIHLLICNFTHMQPMVLEYLQCLPTKLADFCWANVGQYTSTMGHMTL